MLRQPDSRGIQQVIFRGALPFGRRCFCHGSAFFFFVFKGIGPDCFFSTRINKPGNNDGIRFQLAFNGINRLLPGKAIVDLIEQTAICDL